MMLNELIELITDNQNPIKDFEVVLATTIIDGKPIDSGVEIRNISKLQPDNAGPDLYLYPSESYENKKLYKVSDFLEYEINEPENYELLAVDRIKELPAGRTALATTIIIGALWYEENNQLWLLQSPKDQWPNEWFDA